LLATSSRTIDVRARERAAARRDHRDRDHAASTACLRHCQSPLGFFMTHWRDGAGAALALADLAMIVNPG